MRDLSFLAEPCQWCAAGDMRSHVLRVPIDEPRGNCQMCLQRRMERIRTWEHIGTLPTDELLRRTLRPAPSDYIHVLWWLAARRETADA